MLQLRVGTFTPSVLVEVARRTGRLAAAGVEVTEVSVPSSPAQFRSLRAGELDIVVTSPDNVLAYRFLDANPLGERMSVVIPAGLDADAGLSLCVRPGVDLGDTGGNPPVLGVDVPTSGFALAAYGLLELAGRFPGSYSIEPLGSSPRRVSALTEGRCDVTILGAGNELVAEQFGARIPSRVPELGPYVGEVLARTESSGTAAAADALAAVLLETASAIRAGGLDDLTAAAAQDRLGLSAGAAAAHAARLRTTGLLEGGRVPLDALSTLVDLRARYLPDPGLEPMRDRLSEVLVGHARG